MSSASLRLRAMGFSAHIAPTPDLATSWTMVERTLAVVQTLTRSSSSRAIISL